MTQPDLTSTYQKQARSEITSLRLEKDSRSRRGVNVVECFDVLWKSHADSLSRYLVCGLYFSVFGWCAARCFQQGFARKEGRIATNRQTLLVREDEHFRAEGNFEIPLVILLGLFESLGSNQFPRKIGLVVDRDTKVNRVMLCIPCCSGLISYETIHACSPRSELREKCKLQTK